MEMTDDARRWLDATLEGVFAGRVVDPARRAAIRDNLSRLLVAEAERKAVEWGQLVVTTHHLQAALTAFGGAQAFAEPYLRQAEPERAHFGHRGLAYVIDAILIGIAVGILFLPLQLLLAAAGAPDEWSYGIGSPFVPFGDFDDRPPNPAAFAFYALASIAAAVLDVAYFTYMEATRGQTVGKMALRLRVVREDGAPPAFQDALVRNLVKFSLLLTLLDALIMVLAFSKERQRVSDRLARTLVIREA